MLCLISIAVHQTPPLACSHKGNTLYWMWSVNSKTLTCNSLSRTKHNQNSDLETGTHGKVFKWPTSPKSCRNSGSVSQKLPCNCINKFDFCPKSEHSHECYSTRNNLPWVPGPAQGQVEGSAGHPTLWVAVVCEGEWVLWSPQVHRGSSLESEAEK